MRGAVITWREVESYFKKHSYFIYTKGSNKVIAAPERNPNRTRDAVVIGSDCCRVGSSEVLGPYLRQIRNVFGVTAEQIKEG